MDALQNETSNCYSPFVIQSQLYNLKLVLNADETKYVILKFNFFFLSLHTLRGNMIEVVSTNFSVLLLTMSYPFSKIKITYSHSSGLQSAHASYQSVAKNQDRPDIGLYFCNLEVHINMSLNTIYKFVQILILVHL